MTALLVWCRDKDPTEVLDYAVDWSEELDGGDTIVDAEFSAPDPAGLTLQRSDFTATQAIAWLADGEPGTTYTLTCTVTTAAGRTLARPVALRVEAE